MRISDMIAAFLNELLEDENGIAEIQRSQIAGKFNCVPSQINYVLETRFSPEHGYIVESRRGGGGYIRITRVHYDRKAILMHTINAIGNELDVQTASAFLANLLGAGAIDEDIAKIIAAAISCNSLRVIPQEYRDILRASILKQCLLNII